MKFIKADFLKSFASFFLFPRSSCSLLIHRLIRGLSTSLPPHTTLFLPSQSSSHNFCDISSYVLIIIGFQLFSEKWLIFPVWLSKKLLSSGVKICLCVPWPPNTNSGCHVTGRNFHRISVTLWSIVGHVVESSWLDFGVNLWYEGQDGKFNEIPTTAKFLNRSDHF